MSTASKVLLWLLMVVLLVGLFVGGAVYWQYKSTDETQFPRPQLTFGGAPLTASAVQWHTPVLGGLVYKKYTFSQNAQHSLGAITQAAVDFSAPAGTAVEYTVRKNGEVVASGNAVHNTRVQFSANGDYTLQATHSVPQTGKAAYGTVTYYAAFTVAVEPAISFASTRVPQGGALAVKVSGILDGSVPEIESPFGLAHFVQNEAGDWTALSGVHYNREPGTYAVTVRCGALQVVQDITVVDVQFSTQNMVIDKAIAAGSALDPRADVEWRKYITQGTYLTADDTIYWSGRFQKPIDSALNTEYGLTRKTTYTDGTSGGYSAHTGVDLKGAEGDAIACPAAGRVVFAGYLLHTGNTLVIEHGGGLKSYLYHMSALYAAEGDRVEKGQHIGDVGSTGYSTGPHMHYEVRIGNQSINPMDLFDGTSFVYFISQ